MYMYMYIFILHNAFTTFQAEANMKKYGNVLIENVPNESTLFLKALCTNYKPSNKPLVDQVCIP